MTDKAKIEPCAEIKGVLIEPCAECGNRLPYIQSGFVEGGYYVHCATCHWKSMKAATMYEAIASWNRIMKRDT